MERQTTPYIAGQTSLHKSLSRQQEKSRITMKTNSSKEPNKFHSKYVCFGGRKTREERKICSKIHLFGIPETLVMRNATTDPRNVVSFSTLTGPFEFERALKFNGRSCSSSNLNGPIRVNEMKPRRERPLSHASSQGSQECRRGEF